MNDPPLEKDVKRLQVAIAYVREDPTISARNKELVIGFGRDAQLGKTVRGRARKKIGHSRCGQYITTFLHLISYLNKDLDQVTQADMESFIEALEGGQIKTRKQSNLRPCPTPARATKDSSSNRQAPIGRSW